MDVLSIFRRLLILTGISGLGGLVYALCVNIFIMGGLMPTQDVDTAPGYMMTQQAVYVWMFAVLAAAISIFALKQKWRWIFILAPIYAPGLSALLFIIRN